MSSSLRWIIAFSLAVIFSGCAPQQGETPSTSTAEVSPVAFNVTGAPTIEFDVPDMMCEESCAAQVREILTEQEGVKDVKVDFPAKVAIVAVDKKSFDADKALAELIDHRFDNSTLKAQQ